MTDFLNEARKWFARTLIATIVGAVVCGGGFALIEPAGKGQAFVVGAGFGAILFGAVPAVVSVWHLVLHMTGQASEAIRAPGRKKKKKKKKKRRGEPVA